MRRFRDPTLRVHFELNEGYEDPTRWSHKWLCTGNVHANNIIQDVVMANDPFQGRKAVSLNRVQGIIAELIPGLPIA